jgi:hypothetical protein
VLRTQPLLLPPLLLLLLLGPMAALLLLRVLLLLRHTVKVPRWLGCRSRVGMVREMKRTVRMKMRTCPHSRLSHPTHQQQHQAEHQQQQLHKQGVRQVLPVLLVLLAPPMHSPQPAKSVGGTSQQGCSQS